MRMTEVQEGQEMGLAFTAPRFVTYRYVALIAVLLLGCASHTGVVALGNDQFMVAKQQATGFPGLGNMKAEIITEATQYCSSLGKQFELISAQETKPPYVLGNYPRSEIQFRCAPKLGGM